MALLVSACAGGEPYRPIPAGIYCGENADEWLLVKPESVEFHVRRKQETAEYGVGPNAIFIEGTYGYRVAETGELYFSQRNGYGLLTGDVAYLELYLTTYHWKDGKIARVDRNTGASDLFAPGGTDASCAPNSANA